MTRRRVALLAGGLCCALAVAAIVFEGVATVGSTGWLARPGHDYLLLAGVGALVVLAGAGVVTVRSVSGFDGATPPRTEDVPAGTPLGERVDRVIAGNLGMRAHLRGEERAAVRDRLRSTAVDTLARIEGDTRQEARQRVARGEWTDDPTAAAFLAERGPGPLGTRLADAFPGGSRFQRRTVRAVTAVLDLTEGES